MAEGSDKIPTDEYDRTHGKPGSVPDAPAMSEEDKYGTKLNPVRETPPAFTGLKQVG